MENSSNNAHKIYLSVLSFLAWFALIFQFLLHMNSSAVAKAELFIRFFSYFTIDSNLMVAFCSTSILFFDSTNIGKFFSKSAVITAILVYIIVVALIYNVVLRFLWTFKGWGMLTNELLHVIVPFMFLIYWIYFVTKRQLKWADLWSWLIFPLVYTTFVLVRGSYSGFYPYPFLDVTKFGLGKVLVNCTAITMLFALLSVLLIAVGRRQTK